MCCVPVNDALRETVNDWRDIGVWPDGKPVFLFVPGDPIPWSPARTNPKTGGGRFIPNRQLAQADRVAQAWANTEAGMVPKPHGVVIACEFTTVEPASHFRTGKNAELRRDGQPDQPTGRPDLSNLLKLVEDGLTGIAWDDDDQIVRVASLAKRYDSVAGSTISVWLAPSWLLSFQQKVVRPVTQLVLGGGK